MSARFIQIHFLTSYASSLLNRDDAGFAKSITFGGAVRTRVSSQCLKRHWRVFDGDDSISSLGIDGSVRSRLTFEQKVYEPLVKEGFDPAHARDATRAVKAIALGEKEKEPEKEKGAKASAKKGAKKGKAAAAEGATEESATEAVSESTEAASATDDALKTGQVTVFGLPEIRYLLDEARTIATALKAGEKLDDIKKRRFTKEWKNNLAALKNASGFDAAMFGRMVTSDMLARGDAAVHVAHAMTVHSEQSETDFFAVMDDLMGGESEEQLGSGHINTSELTSGLFYGYVVVDVPLLVSNLSGVKRDKWLEGDLELAGKVVDRLVRTIATVTPGAKLGSTAPYASPHLVLIEHGKAQPRTLANAFLQPVSSRPNQLHNAFAQLSGYVKETDDAFGYELTRRHLAIGAGASLSANLGDRGSLKELAAFAASAVTGVAP